MNLPTSADLDAHFEELRIATMTGITWQEARDKVREQTVTIFGVEPYEEGEALVGACGILDVVKSEWTEAWSEHDQKVRAGLSQMLARMTSYQPDAQPIEQRRIELEEDEAIEKLIRQFSPHLNILMQDSPWRQLKPLLLPLVAGPTELPPVERIYAQTLNDDARFKEDIVLATDYDAALQHIQRLMATLAMERTLREQTEAIVTGLREEFATERSARLTAEEQYRQGLISSAHWQHMSETAQAEVTGLREKCSTLTAESGKMLLTLNKAAFETIPALEAENTRLRSALEDGAGQIALERKRQIEEEGWTQEHDDRHMYGELAKRAAALAVAHTDAVVMDGSEEIEPWKKHPAPRSLVIAGALLAAEIDQMLREAALSPAEGKGGL